jgi:hypothetical protein
MKRPDALWWAAPLAVVLCDRGPAASAPPIRAITGPIASTPGNASLAPVAPRSMTPQTVPRRSRTTRTMKLARGTRVTGRVPSHPSYGGRRTAGRRGSCAGSARRPRRRPTSDGRCRSSCRSTHSVSVGLLGTLHEPAVGDDVLDAREAGDVLDLIEEHQRQDLADPGHGAQAGEGVDVVDLGGAGEVQVEVGQEPVIVVEQREVRLDALADRGVGKRSATSVRLAL